MTISNAEHEECDLDLYADEVPYDQTELSPPPITMEEFLAAGANVFRSDEEVDDLIAMVYESRRSGLA